MAEEGIEMKEDRRYREHYASWKLNKRGIDGENIIHLLLNREQPVCYEVPHFSFFLPYVNHETIN